MTRTITRHYDSILRPSGMELKDGTTVENAISYGYDSAGRLKSLAPSYPLPATPDFTYNYVADSYGLIESVTGLAHTVTNTWESDRNVLASKFNQVNLVNPVQTVSSYTYLVNDIGQRTSVDTSGSAFNGGVQDRNWGYDALGQVTEENDANTSAFDRGFAYDAIGNRSASIEGSTDTTVSGGTSYTANALNQYSTINPGSSVNPGYDTDGNLLDDAGINNGTSGDRNYKWDAENRLIEVKDESDGTTIAEYAYDYLGRRVRKSVAGGEDTVFLYDGWNVIAEYDVTSTPALETTYTWGIDLSGSMQGAGGVGGLLAVNDGTSTFYPTYDGNGNVSEYLNASGSSATHYEYDAFGNIVKSTGTPGDFRYRFSTKPLDEELGWYYYGYRYYDPITGRWPSRDPLGERGGINLQGFVNNAPPTSYDHLGLDTNGSHPNGSPNQWLPNHLRGQESNGIKLFETTGDFGPVDAVRRVAGLPIDLVSGDGLLSENIETSYDESQCEFLITVTGIKTTGAGQGGVNGNSNHMEIVSRLPQYKHVPNPTYVDNPTALKGIGDFLQIIGDTVGAIGITSQRLSEAVSKAYQTGVTNGCVEKCIKIHIVAHSQGTAITGVGLGLLPGYIKDNVHFVGLGGQMAISPDGLGSARNIENTADSVPKIPNQPSDLPFVGPPVERFSPSDVELPKGQESGPINGHTLGNEVSGGINGAYYLYLQRHPTR